MAAVAASPLSVINMQSQCCTASLNGWQRRFFSVHTGWRWLTGIRRRGRRRQGRSRAVGWSVTGAAGFHCLLLLLFFIKSFELLSTGSTALLLHSPFLLFTPTTGTLYCSRDLGWRLLPSLSPRLILILTLLLGVLAVGGRRGRPTRYRPHLLLCLGTAGLLGGQDGARDWRLVRRPVLLTESGLVIIVHQCNHHRH